MENTQELLRSLQDEINNLNIKIANIEEQIFYRLDMLESKLFNYSNDLSGDISCLERKVSDIDYRVDDLERRN